MGSTLGIVPTSARALGAFMAAAVSATFLGFCVLLALASSSPTGPLWPFGVAAVVCAIGIPVGAVLGWVKTPLALAPEPPPMGTRLEHSLIGVVLGLGMVAGTFIFANDPTARLGMGARLADIAQGVGYAAAVGAMMGGIGLIYGLLGLGVPALLFGVLVETIWLRLIRRLANARPEGPPSGEAAIAQPLPPFSVAVTGLAAAGLFLAFAATVPGVVELARSNDPPGILYGALLGWFLTLLAPGAIAVVALRRRSWRLLVATAPTLLVLAVVVGMPSGLVYVAAAAALGAAGLAARDADVVGPTAGVLVALLLLAAPVTQEVSADKVCWDIYGQGMGLEMRLSPDEPNGPMEVPILSTGCIEHAYSGVGAALAAGALALAGLTAAGVVRLTPRT